ncbi:MAG TPA: single-stranded DNA-binding protein [Chthoniobacterales bacterium]
MANLNKVQLIGNLTRDPEVKYTPKGMAVTELGMAINRYYTPDGGERREETTFIDITLWGKQAELAGQYLKKGRPVYIEGRLQMDTWEDKQSGQKRSKLRVVGENMQFLDSRRGGGESEEGGYEERRPPSASSAPGAASRPPNRGSSAPNEPADDDIPF